MTAPHCPSLYEINTRLWLAEVSATLGRRATLDDIPDAELDGLAARGFDVVWLLGVWQTGDAARRIALSNPEWRAEFSLVLPDFRRADVCGSSFAVCDYRVHQDFGGDGALAHLRERLAARGLRLVLDFVPNHVAPDHRWVAEHPEFFVEGTEEQLAKEPQNYVRLEQCGRSRILAHGRDPHFAGWADTLQLDHGNDALQEALLEELLRIAGQCDGVRCDMAMLVLPEVFERTWGLRATPFWPRAIAVVRAARPEFLFLAEVYWDLERTLVEQGFDYAYDKRLYDRLRLLDARPVREHLDGARDVQHRLARFLENHDEPRAATTFPLDAHRAAAVVTFLAPGLRFFHQGQLEGRRTRVPVHLARGPVEPVDPAIAAFYDELLACLRDPAYRDGEWRLLEAGPAWEGNASHGAFLAFSWTRPEDRRRLVVVNYAPHQSQCWLTLPWNEMSGREWRLRDRLSGASYQRDGAELAARGLYLDLAAWGYHAFAVEPS